MSYAAQIEAFVRSFGTVPASQRVLVRLLQVLTDNGMDLQDIAAIVKLDPGLSSSVIRLSNSAYFGRASSAESIEEAVTHLGTAELVKVVALVAIQELNAIESDWVGITSEESWRVSVAAALGMERFSDKAGLEPAESYAVGLLHAVGRWMIARWRAVQPMNGGLPPHGYLELAEWEQRNLGVSAPLVSGLMLERWGFSPRLFVPITHQLEPFSAPDGIRSACLLRTMLSLSSRIALPERYPAGIPEIPGKVLSIARVTVDELEEAQPEIETDLAQIDEILG